MHPRPPAPKLESHCAGLRLGRSALDADACLTRARRACLCTAGRDDGDGGPSGDVDPAGEECGGGGKPEPVAGPLTYPQLPAPPYRLVCP